MADNPLSIDTLRGSSSPLLAKMALAMLSNELSTNPTARAAFIRNPSGFIRENFGQAGGPAEEAFFNDLATMYADGNCCYGCGCGGPHGSACGPQGSGCTAVR